MPIWIAYIAAPLFLLAITSGIIRESESPVVLSLFAIGSGLACAACLHGYVAIKKRLFPTASKAETPTDDSA